jgi:NIMA (never in mitosis gene a)-related kinase
LIYFGYSKQVEYILKSTNTPVETWINRSPEILEELEYSTNTDVWSLVCVIFELITLKHPFSYSQYNYSTMVIQQAIPNFDDLCCSHELKLLIKQILCYYPSH